MIDYQKKTIDGRPRIVIIEPNDSVREGYVNLLQSDREYLVISSYADTGKAIKNLWKDAPAVVLMEIDLPETVGLNAIRKIKKTSPHTNILIVTDSDEQPVIFEAFAAGASGYMMKGANHGELLRAIEEVLNNGAPLSPRITKKIVTSFQRSPDSPLSNRETEILSSLARGKTYKLTANDLHIGMETVKSHVKNIYSKLRVSTKSEAIDLARRRSLI